MGGMSKNAITTNELLLMVEALVMAAGRHESMGRFNPRSAGPHDRKAKAMRELRLKLMEMQSERGGGMHG